MNKTLLVLFTLLTSVASFGQQLPRPALQINPLLECRGKATIVAFIVTSCGHCKAFTRDVLEPLSRSSGVCALAIAFDQDGDTAKFAKDQRLTFPVYKLERSIARSFLGMSGPERPIGTPQVVLIDKRGMIQAQSKPEGSPLLLQRDVILQILEKIR